MSSAGDRSGRGSASTLQIWLKTPFLLFRFPGALLAVVGASAVVALAAASDPMFLSSAGGAALQSAVVRSGEGISGLRAGIEAPLVSHSVEYRTDLFTEAVEGIEGVGEVRTTFVATGQAIAAIEGTPRPDRFVRLATVQGFEQRIRIVERSEQEGWWVSRAVARQLDIHPGDRLRLTLADDFGQALAATTTVTVRGVYVDLCGLPPSTFWTPLAEYTQLQGDTCPPPLLLADPATFMDAERILVEDADQRWEAPVDPTGLTLQQADDLSAVLGRVQARLANPLTPLGAAFTSSGLGLPALVEDARATERSLAGSVHAVSIAGRLLALLVAGIAGAYTVHRRRIEFHALFTRGVSPARLGLTAAAEATLPALIGMVLGWGAAVALVRTLGPSDRVDGAAATAGLVQAALASLLGVVVLGLVAGLVVRAMGERKASRVRTVLTRLPWELAPLALAAAALVEIRGGDVASGGASDGPPSVDVLVPLFPILFMAGAGGLVVRGFRRVLPRLRRVGGDRSAPLFLAARRLAVAPGVALLLVTASLLAVGTLAYSGALVSSLSNTADQKARVFVGSDAAITLSGLEGIPDGILRDATPVARYTGTTIGPDAVGIHLLAIDPSSFAREAFWSSRFGDRSLEEILDAISTTAGDALPLILVGPGTPGGPSMDLLGYTLASREVARVRGFPGMVSRIPLVVTSHQALATALAEENVLPASLQPQSQLWVRGDVESVVRRMERAGLAPSSILTAQQVRSVPSFQSLSWTFGFLQALGALAGVVALVGLLLYLQARQATREVSYALARRMGLGRGAHRFAVLLELLGMLVPAFVAGLGLAWAAAAMTYGELDFLPEVPPGPLLHLPLALFGAIGIALAVFAALGAIGVQRRADRANVAEVMRFAG